MSISFYILSALNILLTLAAAAWGGLPESFHMGMAAILVTIVGIPHGAIDHTLFLKSTRSNLTVFFTFYLLLIGLYVYLWIHWPVMSMAFFLMLSSYHFGQSQLQKYLAVNKSIRWIMYVLWGTVIISGLIVFNFDEILKLMNNDAEFLLFQPLFQYSYFSTLFVGSLVLLLGFLVFFSKQMGWSSIGRELLYLGLILITFYSQPLFLGFSLYFATSHSLDVMFSEYRFLLKRNQSFNIAKFLKSLLPFTLLSLFGIAFLMMLIIFNWIAVNPILLLFIVISSLTLPHSVVMEYFYRKQQKTQLI